MMTVGECRDYETLSVINCWTLAEDSYRHLPPPTGLMAAQHTSAFGRWHLVARLSIHLGRSVVNVSVGVLPDAGRALRQLLIKSNRSSMISLSCTTAKSRHNLGRSSDHDEFFLERLKPK